MEWDLSKSISGVSLGKLGMNEAYAAVTGEMYSGYILGWTKLSTR